LPIRQPISSIPMKIGSLGQMRISTREIISRPAGNGRSRLEAKGE
jgi:hypothetical protein